MGSPRFTLCTGVLAATLLLAPAAHAADGGRGVSVIPSTPAVGGEVALKVSGCTGRTAKAISDAFVSDARLIGTGGTLAGETKIRSTAEPRAYDVRITCADAEIKGRITVVGPGASPHATPVAPVHAGGGGAADLLAARPAPGTRTLAQPEATAPNTAHAVTGLTLAGLAALAVLALRGVLRRRNTAALSTGARTGTGINTGTGISPTALMNTAPGTPLGVDTLPATPPFSTPTPEKN
ncbi:MAG TPA: hypothetical protein VIU15_26500 [Streptomyces sp.]